MYANAAVFATFSAVAKFCERPWVQSRGDSAVGDLGFTHHFSPWHDCCEECRQCRAPIPVL